jgi:hypothetical protein
MTFCHFNMPNKMPIPTNPIIIYLKAVFSFDANPILNKEISSKYPFGISVGEDPGIPLAGIIIPPLLGLYVPSTLSPILKSSRLIPTAPPTLMVAEYGLINLYYVIILFLTKIQKINDLKKCYTV